MTISNSKAKSLVTATLLSIFGFVTLPGASAVVLGVGTTVAMSDMAWAAPNKTPSVGGEPRVTARGIKDPGVRSCGNCGLTGRKKNSRSGAVRRPPGTVRR